MTLISGRNKHKLSNESIEGKDPYTWSKISIICFESQFAFYPGVFIMDTKDKQSNNILDTQDKQSNNIFDTQDKRSNNIFIQSILRISFFNGHTGQTDKQHIYSKHFTHVFLEWTHRTNGQTTYLFKGFYPCL